MWISCVLNSPVCPKSGPGDVIDPAAVTASDRPFERVCPNKQPLKLSCRHQHHYFPRSRSRTQMRDRRVSKSPPQLLSVNTSTTAVFCGVRCRCCRRRRLALQLSVTRFTTISATFPDLLMCSEVFAAPLLECALLHAICKRVWPLRSASVKNKSRRPSCYA